MKKNELKKLLNYHDNLYYNQDDPEITDTEYDALKNLYVSLYGEYDYVPGKALFNKVKHTTNISSLDKVQITDMDKLRAEIIRLWPVVIQPKMDGLTIVSYPNNTDVTRGNGEIGEDVSEAIRAGVKGKGIVRDKPIRSEAVMLLSEFRRINEERIKNNLKPFKNARNAAAGMLRNKSTEKVEGLMLFAYNVISEYSESNLNQSQLDELQLLGWNTVFSYVPTTVDEAINYIVNFDRSTLDYEIDGLVVKHNGNKQFGFTGHHPKSAIAVKFEAQGAWTTLNNIVWQVGRVGKITPVAEFEPVEILGATVTRATLHNMGIIEALKLDKLLYDYDTNECRTRIKVVKANDVIPAIVEVEKYTGPMSSVYYNNILEPSSCPDCGGEVEKVNDQLFCINSNCPSRILGKLVHLAQRDAFDISGLSEETSKKLIAFYKNALETTKAQMLNSEEVGEYVSEEDYKRIDDLMEHMHPSFIYDISLREIENLPGFAKKSATKLYNEIQASKNIDFDRFLYGCGIPLIGKKASRDIATFYSDINKDNPAYAFAKDYADKFKMLKHVDGIGDGMIQNLLDNYESHVVPFGNYDMTFKPVFAPKKASNQLTFVITGEFDIKRTKIKQMIEEAGHKVAGSVSTKTNILLSAPGEESTSKYKKATDLNMAKKANIKIINSLEELHDLLRETN